MNMSIECDVIECKYNSNLERYCTLNRIKIAEPGEATNGIETAQCASFEPR
ncbi:MAG: DUF1540 domain-containing protein [Cellulosilyticaceae bacterium]